MKFIDFRKIAASLSECSDFEYFVELNKEKECWNEYCDDKVDSILHSIWQLKDRPIHGLRSESGISARGIATAYGIPIRTIEGWSAGNRVCPEYVWMLLAYAVFCDSGII